MCVKKSERWGEGRGRGAKRGKGEGESAGEGESERQQGQEERERDDRRIASYGGGKRERELHRTQNSLFIPLREITVSPRT